MTQTRRRFLITPLERPVLDDFSKQTFNQTSLHSWAVTKIWKASTTTIQLLWSDSEKCLLSWIVSQVHPLSPKKTKSVPPLQHSKMSSQSNNSSFRKFLPERILTSLKAAHLLNINGFCGDQSKIARLNENWSLSDRGTNRHYLHCSCTLIWSLFINCCFNHKFFH